MAKFEQYRARSTKLIAQGELTFDPAMGQLYTPPAYPYTGDLQFKIGDTALVVNREEFVRLAAQVEHAKRIIDTMENG